MRPSKSTDQHLIIEPRLDSFNSDSLQSAPYISVVIVSWNALETIKKCLPSVAATQHTSFEVLFVDNASQDESVEWIQHTYPDIRIVSHPENWAYCKGNNRAVEHARGELLVLLNNDVEVPPTWLDAIDATFRSNPDVGAAQPKIHQFNNRSMFEYAGAAGGFLDKDGYPFTRGRIFDTVEEDHGQYDTPQDLFWASGTCLVIRKALYQQLNGFEEAFFMHMEEIDLCWRLRSLGHRIVLIPESVVYHIGGASLSNQSSRKLYLNFRNNLLMLYRNLPAAMWKKVFLRRCFLDCIALLKALLSLRPRHALAILSAYKDALRMMKSYSHFRPLPGAAIPLPYQGSVIIDYYLKGRKHFSSLPASQFTSL